MIRKIHSIDGMGVFDGFKWDTTVLDNQNKPMTFGKINIIYGRNYSGKTTISRIMRALETRQLPDKYDNPAFSIQCDDGGRIDQSMLQSHALDVRVFNEDFVRTNLRFLSDSDKEISAFAILGSDNDRIEKEISTIAAALGSNRTGNETGLYAERKRKKENQARSQLAYSRAQHDLEEKLKAKALDRQRGIKYNPQKFGDQNYTTTKLNQDIQDVLKPTYALPNLKTIYELELITTERAKPPAPERKIPQMRYSDYLANTFELLSRPIGTSKKISELLLDTALNEWVKTGAGLHIQRDSCAFCGGYISDERRAVIHAHFDEESKKLESDIVSCIRQMEAEKKALPDAFRVDENLFYSVAHAQLDSLEQRFLAESACYCAQLDSLIEQLNARRNQITVPLQLSVPEDHRKMLASVFDDYAHLRANQEDYKSGLTKKQMAARKALRLVEVANFCETIGYAALSTTIADLKAKQDQAACSLCDLENMVYEQEGRIVSLRRQQKDEEEGAQRVNTYLNDYFGHNFLRLQSVLPEGENPHIRFEIVRNGKKAFNLSEGECSLIAFCYFMAKLHDIDTDDKKPIIWIDDPISSLDSNHVFFAYSLLRAEIVEREAFNQLFVSTHNLDFFKYMKRLSKDERDTGMRYLIIHRTANGSMIQNMPEYMKTYVTEFNYLFHEIYKCASINVVSDVNYTSFYNFGNNARKFLEILMFYYYPIHDSSVNKLEKFFGVGRVPALLTDRISNEYSHLCGVFERGEALVEVPEMLTTARLIIATLQQKNPEQYAALMKSIGEEPTVQYSKTHGTD